MLHTAYKPCNQEKLFIKKRDLVPMRNACSLVPPSVTNFFSLFYSYIINSAVSFLNASTTVIIASGMFHWKFLMAVLNMVKINLGSVLPYLHGRIFYCLQCPLCLCEPKGQNSLLVRLSSKTGQESKLKHWALVCACCKTLPSCWVSPVAPATFFQTILWYSSSNILIERLLSKKEETRLHQVGL